MPAVRITFIVTKKLSEQILKHWNKSRDVHPCDLVPLCQVSRCPQLLHGFTLSSLAMSVSTILMVSRCQVSRFQSPRFWRSLLQQELCRL